MPCELTSYCQFFNDNMKSMPKAASYIKEKICFGDYESCNRYRIFKEFGGVKIPSDLDPSDSEAVKKVLICMGKKQRPKE